MQFLGTTKGKLVALLVFYLPLLSAFFFNFFDGERYESPIGGCCIPMEGVVIAGYGLFTIWILIPLALVYTVYKLLKKGRQG